MRSIVILVALLMLASVASAQIASRTYWLLSKDGGQVWCAYTDPQTFNGQVIKVRPTESAIVTYSLTRLTQLIHQIQAPGGDWSVADQYTPSHDGIVLRRVNYLNQQNLQVTESAVIRAGRAGPLRVDGVTTLQGKSAAVAATPATPTLPSVPVITDLDTAPFMLLVTQMRHESIPSLCRKLQ